MLGIVNVGRTCRVPSWYFMASKTLKLSLQQFNSPLFCGKSRDMFVPNSLPIGISNGIDLVDYIKQTLEFSNGELCPPSAFCHDKARFCWGRPGDKHSHK